MKGIDTNTGFTSQFVEVTASKTDYRFPTYNAKWTLDGCTWFFSDKYPNCFIRMMHKTIGIKWERC